MSQEEHALLLLQLRDAIRNGEPVEIITLAGLVARHDPDEPLLLHCQALALFELCRFDKAHRLFREAADADDTLAEPLFYLGILAERAGDGDEAMRLFGLAVERDPENFVLPKRWTREEVEAAFDAMVEEIPGPLGTWLAGLPLEFEEHPDPASLERDGDPISPLVHCLFEGAPSGGAEGDEPEAWLTATPTRVVLYLGNIGKSAQDEYELEREVFEAVLWEVMEFLGLGDEHLSALGVIEREDVNDDDIHPST